MYALHKPYHCCIPKKVGFTRYLGLTKVGKNSLILT